MADYLAVGRGAARLTCSTSPYKVYINHYGTPRISVKLPIQTHNVVSSFCLVKSSIVNNSELNEITYLLGYVAVLVLVDLASFVICVLKCPPSKKKKILLLRSCNFLLSLFKKNIIKNIFTIKD